MYKNIWLITDLFHENLLLGRGDVGADKIGGEARSLLEGDLKMKTISFNKTNIKNLFIAGFFI